MRLCESELEEAGKGPERGEHDGHMSVRKVPVSWVLGANLIVVGRVVQL